jgi:hypothetical protein
MSEMMTSTIPMTLAQATGSPWIDRLASGALGAIVALLGGYLLLRWLGRKWLDTARNDAERLLTEARGEAESSGKRRSRGQGRVPSQPGNSAKKATPCAPS